jgi:hypothetical protein
VARTDCAARLIATGSMRVDPLITHCFPVRSAADRAFGVDTK